MPTTEADVKVAHLVEALPYVQRWRKKTIVVKYGGAAQTTPELSLAVMEDLVLLYTLGIRVVLVHGGGPAVSAMGKRLGIEPKFVDGLRVTDDETMRTAQLVQVGGISRDIVAGLGRRGAPALGVSGQDGGGFLRAKRRAHKSATTGEDVDLGRVGDVTSVDAAFLRGVLGAGLLPVVAPVAVDDDFDALNVNADGVATAVAGALGADKLVFLTDVSGIKGADGVVRGELEELMIRAWIQDGTISGGMIPKAEACLDALSAGVGFVTIADGRVPHALLIELFTDAGVGTQVRR